MDDPSRHPDSGDGSAAGSDQRSSVRTPRWVKVFAIVAGVVILLLVILLLTGGHGPSRHSLSDAVPGWPPAAAVVQGEHAPSTGSLG